MRPVYLAVVFSVCLLVVVVRASVEDLEGNDKDVHNANEHKEYSSVIRRRLAIGEISSKFHVCAYAMDADDEDENDIDFDVYNSDDGLVVAFDYHYKNQTTGEMVRNDLQMQVVFTKIIEFYDTHKGYQPGQQVVSEYSLKGQQWSGFSHETEQVHKNITLVSFASTTADQVLRIGGFITDQESIDSPGMVHLSPNHLFLKFHVLRFPHAAEYTSLALEAQVQTRSSNSIRLADGEFELSTPNQDGVEGMFRWFPWSRMSNTDYPVAYHASKNNVYFSFMRKGEIHDLVWQPEMGIRYTKRPDTVMFNKTIVTGAIIAVAIVCVAAVVALVVLWRMRVRKNKGQGTVEEKSSLLPAV